MHTSITSRTIGKYQVVDRIGIGGMGEVFRARQSGEGGFVKYIALKSLLPQRTYDQEYLRRFLQEAKIVGRLNHQNIVQVFDTFQEEGVWYIAMELIDGHDLGNLLLRCASSREPIPQVWIAYILSEALRGLDHAHKKTDESGRPFGIVHRDISPENILISYEGSVKVTDFGVAKGFQQPTGAYLVGKPRYMAPEQARGGAIDGRADVYSGGVVLWEAMAMTAAAVAGDAWNPAEYEPPAPGQPFPQLPGTPGPISAAIAKATRSNPDERYRDAEAFAADLRRFVAKEMPDFSPLDLGRFVGQKFADEQAERVNNLRRFEETAGPPVAKRLTPTVVSQKRRGTPEHATNGSNALDLGEALGPEAMLGTPAPTVIARTPAPKRVAESLGVAAGASGTDVMLRNYAKSARRRKLGGIGAVIALAAGIGGLVYALQTRSATGASSAPPPTLPPVMPSLEPPPGAPSAPAEASPAPAPPAPQEEEADVGDEDTSKVEEPPKAGTPAHETERHPVAAKKLGQFAVETVPEGASIRINGKPIRQRSPVTLKGMPIGHRVSVEVSMAGFAPEERQVVVAETQAPLHVTLRPLEGVVRVGGAPPGARIVFDGQATLVNPIPAKPGTHRIEVSAPGFMASARQVTLSPGQVLDVPMPLAPVPSGPGMLEVRCRPFCKLLVDGKDRGVIENGTPAEVKLPPGEHHVEARQVQSARRKSQDVKVKAGETMAVTFDLSD